MNIHEIRLRDLHSEWILTRRQAARPYRVSRVHIIIPGVPRKNVLITRGTSKISAEALYVFVPRLLIEYYFL